MGFEQRVFAATRHRVMGWTWQDMGKQQETQHHHEDEEM